MSTRGLIESKRNLHGSADKNCRTGSLVPSGINGQVNKGGVYGVPVKLSGIGYWSIEGTFIVS